MRYVPKHSAARKSSARLRAAGVVVAAGAVVGAGMATAPAASAAPSNVWDRVAACESGGNWSIATGNGYYGGLQFSASSWRAAGGTRYASMPHRASKAQQIAAAQQLLRMQGPGAWPVCSRKAGLTRANGLASGGGAMTASRSATRPAAAKPASNALPAVDRMTVRRMQTWVGHQRTGVWTTQNTRALQRKVRADVDGIIGPQTVRRTEVTIGAKRSGASSFTSGTMRQMSTFLINR